MLGASPPRGAKSVDLADERVEEAAHDEFALFSRGEGGVSPDSRFGIGARAGRISGETAGTMRLVVLHGFREVDAIGGEVEHERRLDFVGMRAADLLRDLLFDGSEGGEEIRVVEGDAVRGEQLLRGGEGAIRGDPRVERVETAGPVVGRGRDDVDDEVARRLEAERGGAGITDERWIIGIRDGGEHDEIGTSRFETSGPCVDEDVIVVEAKVRPVLLRGSADGEEDDRFGREHARRLFPGQVAKEHEVDIPRGPFSPAGNTAQSESEAQSEDAIWPFAEPLGKVASTSNATTSSSITTFVTFTAVAFTTGAPLPTKSK